jgi:hypothetical protein
VVPSGTDEEEPVREGAAGGTGGRTQSGTGGYPDGFYRETKKLTMIAARAGGDLRLFLQRLEEAHNK